MFAENFGLAFQYQDDAHDGEEKYLEKQIFKILKGIEIPQTFYDWGIKELREESTKENTDRYKITENLQRTYNACAKKIESLIDMRMNNELNEQEFLEMKEKLFKDLHVRHRRTYFPNCPFYFPCVPKREWYFSKRLERSFSRATFFFKRLFFSRRHSG